jgi:hypothetical protein
VAIHRERAARNAPAMVNEHDANMDDKTDECVTA